MTNTREYAKIFPEIFLDSFCFRWRLYYQQTHCLTDTTETFSSSLNSSIFTKVGFSSVLLSPRSSRTSLVSRMSAAPRRMSICGPSEVGEVIGPGTHPTSLLYSVAKREVMRVPDRLPASITRVAWHIPAIILFLLGKAHAPLGMVSSYSE